MIELGTSLRDSGLQPRALAAWAGTDRLSALPRLRLTVVAGELTPAAALLALFVGGDDVPVDRLPALDLDTLHRHDLIDVVGTTVRGRVAILPLGSSLVVCDRQDRISDPALVCWPDDSSYHLANALPSGRRARWLDLGCGSAFAPLRQPGLAGEILGADVNPRALRFARLGAALSGVGHFATCEADLGDGVPVPWRGACQLVTCNAPIPEAGGDPSRPHWQATTADFVDRLYAHAATLVTPGGLVVVHAVLDALAPVVAALPGERVVVGYTPNGSRSFAIAWWRPDGDARHVTARRLLTPRSPHLTHDDRVTALAGDLPPL